MFLVVVSVVVVVLGVPVVPVTKTGTLELSQHAAGPPNTSRGNRNIKLSIRILIVLIRCPLFTSLIPVPFALFRTFTKTLSVSCSLGSSEDDFSLKLETFNYDGSLVRV